ncbi:MAG: hypothetical protein N2235_11545 [Fischerella sp.]|nr:hypothetical protein [Fischerella sp.]
MQNTGSEKGKIRKVLVDPLTTPSKQPVSQWQVGGIGGKKAETLGVPSTVTGHFGFGQNFGVCKPI